MGTAANMTETVHYLLSLPSESHFSKGVDFSTSRDTCLCLKKFCYRDLGVPTGLKWADVMDSTNSLQCTDGVSQQLVICSNMKIVLNLDTVNIVSNEGVQES